MRHLFTICSALQVAARVGVPNQNVHNCIIWGNHSSTQFPDVSHATVDKDGKSSPVYGAVKDDDWLKGAFIKVSMNYYKIKGVCL